MAPTVQKFLALKGGVGLLSVLNERGKTYSEIESEVAITSDTISKRKDEALEIGLIEMKPARRENRTVTEYHLTDLGEELVRQMSLKGIVSNYLSMRTHQREVDAKTADLIDWVYENPSQLLEYTESHEETLIDRNDRGEEADEADGAGDEEEEAAGEDEESSGDGSPRVVRPLPEDGDDAGDIDTTQGSLEDVDESDPGGDVGDGEPEYPDEFMVDEVVGEDDSETGPPEYPDEFMERYVVGDEEPPDDEVPEDLQPHEVWGTKSDDEEPDDGQDNSE